VPDHLPPVLVECNVLLASARPPAHRLVECATGARCCSCLLPQDRLATRGGRTVTTACLQNRLWCVVESKTLATSKSPRWPSSPSSCKPALRFDRWPSETGGAACSRSHPLPHGCRPTSFAPVERVVGILNTTSSVAGGG